MEMEKEEYPIPLYSLDLTLREVHALKALLLGGMSPAPLDDAPCVEEFDFVERLDELIALATGDVQTRRTKPEE
ncbi:hypothetical protein [Leptolyngbya sp. KIOST-1]|uniref:hypothetical protein n=1 Tax=Leptolyngbya sp. KIOST-1 TaxID=1229172 RepID=UPI00055FAF51|nr:hypothetical protein [Leptolyngbya sp. KIOST-1]